MFESPATTPLEYQTRSPDRRQEIKGWYILYLTVLVMGTVSIGLILLWSVPASRELMRDFRIILPKTTEWVFAALEAAQSILTWILAAFVVFALPFPLALWTDRPRIPSRRFARAIIVLLLMMILFMTVHFVMMAALNAPIAELLRSIGGGGP